MQSQLPGFSTRLHLKVGRDVQDVTVYRNVSVVGLTTTFNGGVSITVSNEDTQLTECWQHCVGEHLPRMQKAYSARRTLCT